MTSELVTDTSFLVKLALPDPLNGLAEQLGDTYTFIAPDLILAEFANALWKMVRFAGLAPESAQAAFDAGMPVCSIVPIEMLASDALELAIQLSHSVYDCLFVSLARRRSAPMITADRKLVRLLAARMPEIECFDLAEFPEHRL